MAGGASPPINIFLLLGGVIVVVMGSFAAFTYWQHQKEKNQKGVLKGTVSKLIIYPIKSCRGIEVYAAIVEKRGLLMDRIWMVVNGSGRFRTQRQLPLMSQIQPNLPSSFHEPLVLSAPKMPSITVPVIKTGKTLDVKVWNDTVKAYDQGDEVAQWISEFLGEEGLRLVRFDDLHKRQVELEYAQRGQTTGFADGFPFLLASESSLEELNSRLKGIAPIPINRFRPNIVIKGSSLIPWEEDKWHRICIGDMRFRLTKPCARCKMPNINQETSEIGEEPGNTLRSYRTTADLGFKGGKNEIFFGQNVVNDSRIGMLRIGDEVEVLDEKK